jgi:hypothetical protein
MKTRLFNALNAVLLLLIPTVNFAQAPPLGTAADFVLFTSVGAVTNVGTYKYLTHLTGNVGSNSGSSTNFGNVNGVMHDGDGASGQCATDLLLAYNSLSAAIPTATLLNPVIGNDTTLNAGIYFMPGAASLNLGLTLNAQGSSNAVFIFKTPTAVAYAFTANPNSKIHLINGAKACNVFWLVSGAVNMGVGVTMRGTIVSGGAISMGAQDTLEGRALTINGAITVSNGALGFLAYTPIGCGSPYLTGPAAPTFVGLASYAVFATTGSVSDCGTSHVAGDIGGNTVQPTGWNPDSVTGTIHFNDPSTQAAAGDLLLVYNYLLGLTYDIKLLDPAEFGHNLVLTPHTYQMNAAVTFTDTLYLDAMGNADAVFIIKTYGAFASTPGSQVLLVNGTRSKNVYWFCTGAVSITANSNFKGAIIAHDAIDILTGAKLDGRAFSTNGAISTCGMTATIPSTSVIITQPSNKTACVGSSVSFSITASGTGLTYQWRKGTSNLINGGTISGATSDTLRINPVNLSDAATNYNVIVFVPSAPNDTSVNVSLVVNPTVGTPTSITVSAGIEPTCQLTNGTTTTTYATTATNNTGFNWSLSNGLAGSIGATTGVMTWSNGFSGTVNIQVTASGCNGPSAQVIRTVTVMQTVGTPVFTMGATSTRCQGAGTVTYTATATNSSGITYILDAASLAAGNSIVTATGAVTYVAGWVGVSLITATATGCYGPSIASHLATTNPRPGPTITGPASVCPGSTGNVYTTEAGMSGYTWTVSVGGTLSGGGGTNAITVTWNTAGAQTVSVNYTNAYSCPALAPTVFNVTVNALPVPTITGPTSICMGSTGNVYTTQAGMTGYNWAVSAGGTITTGGGTYAITVTWNTAGAKTVSVSYTNANGCTAAAPTVFNVTVNVLPVPTITGQSSMCVNSGYYNYTTETGMTNYVWSVSAGGVINYGSGTNLIQVSWIIAGPQTVSVNYSNGFSCSAATPTVLNVTVNPLPNQAGTITGTANVCAGTNGVAYTVAPIPNANTYVWTLPPYATIASGMGTNSITVNYGTNALSGNIFVYGNNLCGNGAASPPFAVTVNALPATAGIITGPASVCQGATGVVYTVPAIAGASSYTWTVPAGATIVSGANTNSITVDFSPAAVSGNITVFGTNSCGNGTVSPNFAVTVNPIPPAPVVTNIGTTLYSSAPTGNQWYYSATSSGTGAPISGATGQTYVATQDGYYWSVVTINGCSSDSSNHKLVITTGIDSHSSSGINVYPNPNEGVFTLMITSPKEEKYNLRVFNNLGVQIFEMKNLDVVGTTRQTIDLSSATSGIYTIVIWNSNYSSVKKVVVSK